MGKWLRRGLEEYTLYVKMGLMTAGEHAAPVHRVTGALRQGRAKGWGLKQ